MRDLSRPVTRFASVLEARGGIAIGAGAVALAWPDEVLLPAMLLTGLVLAASAIYEVTFAVRHRAENRGWPLALADGLACLGLATLIASLTAIPFHATLVLAAVWFLVGGGLAFALALAVWPMRRTRAALLAWSATQLTLAAFAAIDREADLVLLLFVGAGYTIAFGIFQVVAAVWMRRVAAPQFAPTQQERWIAPHAR